MMIDSQDRPTQDSQDARLLALLTWLERAGYRFVTPTPATHARVVARAGRREARSIEDVLGWSLPFRRGTVDPQLEDLLDAAGQLEDVAGLRRARIRVSRLHDRLFLHSAYPTDDPQAVFFGPDSYRFADLIRQELAACPLVPAARMVDIGTGSGVGGIVAATACPRLEVQLTDVNPAALRLARINAQAAGIAVTLFETDGLDCLEAPVDLATANPPYIIDEAGRLYRDGGAMHGGQVSLDMATMALARLAPGGRLILYTGSAIAGGEDELRAALARAAAAHGCTMRYREIDPDVFGEELEQDRYADVDRIALVAAVFVRGG